MLEGHVAEEVWELCPCHYYSWNDDDAEWERSTPRQPHTACVFCAGSGYRLTKRIIRPLPKPDFSEQAAQSEIRTLQLQLLRAANTLKADATRLLEPDHAKRARYAHEARAAAKAIRDGLPEDTA